MSDTMIHFGTCDKCGTSGQFVPDGKGGVRIRNVNTEAMQDDIAEMLRALGLSDRARDASPHEVVIDEVLPAIKRLTRQRDELNQMVNDTQALLVREQEANTRASSPDANREENVNNG